MAPLFPFVVVPPVSTLNELRKEKPLLYLAIVTIGCQEDTNRQLQFAQIFREEVSQAVFIRGEKNLALLEGILVYVAWGHVHMQLSNQLFNLLHMPFAMVTELGLNLDPNSLAITSPGMLRNLHQGRTTAISRTFEERRILLGVFWLGSITRTCFKEVEALRFTSYMDECCVVLDEAQNRSDDRYLVRLVRLQEQAERISRMFYTEGLETFHNLPTQSAVAISSFEKSLSPLPYVHPAHVSIIVLTTRPAILLISYHTLRLHLCKVALDEKVFLDSSPSGSNIFPASSYSTFRADLLTSCLASTEALLSLFFSLPPQTVLSMPYAVWGQLGHAILTLSRLSEVKTPTWNSAYVSSVVDSHELYKRLAARLEDVIIFGMQTLSPPRKLAEPFSHLIARLRELATATPQDTQQAVNVFSEEDVIDSIPFDFFDIDQLF
ncbi:hypothetical protein CC78DRAFT_607015 [Lojkania enalia]|uniref:Uncharacterized protein n=1 Tax=Lojkania enalia TaxID=147567 RepID=A0A9P4K3I4_9PLEO|nr:hypothetical protein CC78DRAFT_607015 [Didymosphaeria enalia]